MSKVKKEEVAQPEAVEKTAEEQGGEKTSVVEIPKETFEQMMAQLANLQQEVELMRAQPSAQAALAAAAQSPVNQRARMAASQRRAIIRGKLDDQEKVQVRVKPGRGIVTLATICGIPYKVRQNPDRDVYVEVPIEVGRIAFERFDGDPKGLVVVHLPAHVQRTQLAAVGEPAGKVGRVSDPRMATIVGRKDGKDGPELSQLMGT